MVQINGYETRHYRGLSKATQFGLFLFIEVDKNKNQCYASYQKERVMAKNNKLCQSYDCIIVGAGHNGLAAAG